MTDKNKEDDSKKGKKQKKKQEAEKEELFEKAQYITRLTHSFGFESRRLCNLHFIDSTTLLTAAGNTVQFLDIQTGDVELMIGNDGGGIGAICVHPSGKYFVVAEKGTKPNVYVYTFPAKEVVNVLKNGTELEFSSCGFNADGSKLATVGAEPDFMLTVWNWMEEKIILRSKAFGTRVNRVTFSSADDGQLTTCGSGHIKFWQMARTFTGLKLQGQIGKFGKIEISDISGYVELPDGKVLSGCEWGSLLLWEAGLVKVEIQRMTTTCHEGAVEVVLIEGSDCLITAGHDGYMRWWDFQKIDMADRFDSEPVYKLEPFYEILVCRGAQIKGVTKSESYWMVQDGNGAFWSVPFISYQEIMDGNLPPVQGSLLKHFHAGPVTCLEPSASDHTAITGGADGTVRLFDYINRNEIYRVHYSSGASSMVCLPLAVDPEQRTYAVGFENGVVRVIRRCAETFALTAVVKPHTEKVVSLAYSDDCTLLVTVSKDGTIFYFTCIDPLSEYKPTGFSKLPATPRHCCWDRHESQFIVSLDDGNVILMETPIASTVDQSISFEFEATYRSFVYNQKMKAKEEPAKEEDIKQEDEDEEEEEEEQEEAEEEAEDEDQGPWPVNFCVITPATSSSGSGRMILGLQHKESVFEYMAHSWSSPDYDVFAEDPNSNLAYYETIAVSARYSRSNKFFILACENGRVLLRPGKDIHRCFHSILVHDGMYGTVLQATTSFDDAYLLTVGKDGCFFVQSVSGQEPVQPDAVSFPAAAAETVAHDITNLTAYSIQEAKMKADEDRKKELAEQKKKSLREQVQDLMAEFEQIVEENKHAEKGKQISKEQIELDSSIREYLQKVNEERVENAKKELAWETAKKELRLEKLRACFIKTQQVERILLHGFKSSRSVSSFRTAQLTDRQKEQINSVHELIASEEAKRKRVQQASMGSSLMDMKDDGADSTSHSHGEQSGFSESGRKWIDAGIADAVSREHSGLVGESGASPSQQGPSTLNSTQMSSTLNTTKKKKRDVQPQTKSALDKAEERKREREEREKGLSELNGRKPNENTEDTRDMAAIMKAEKNMGDYKLKTDPDYVVPENQRVTAERKLRQLILLEESINTLRMDFNDRFLALRDLKRRLIENINRDNKRIAEINTQLQLDESLFWPLMTDDEQPENRTKVDKETLRKFEKEQIKAQKRAVALEKAKAQFGADLMAGMEEEEDEDSSDEEGRDSKKEQKETEAKPKTGLQDKMEGKLGRARVRRESFHMTPKQKSELERKERLDLIQKSDIQLEEEFLDKQKLVFEKNRLQRKIDKTVATFDDALDEIRREKFKLEGDLKMADMKLLLLYRELMLLKDFKKRDQQLTKKHEERRQEKAEITQKNRQCQDKLAEKKTEIEKLVQRQNQILSDFQAATTNQQTSVQEALVKIFRKKIKRRKKLDEAGSIESGSSGSDFSDMSDDDDDDEDFEEEEVCPANCDPETFQKVLELRERRLDQEDIVNDFYKAIDLLRKENEQLTSKEKKVDTQLKQVEKEIQAFQNEKQKKLNELETVVVLKLKQIQCLTDEEKLPRDMMQNLVVFTNQGLRTLHSRILDLFQEKKNLSKHFQDLKRQHVMLTKSRKEKHTNVLNWESKVYEIQLLKFGQKINIDLLENVSVDRKTEELKAQLRAEEAKWEAELNKWDFKLQDAKQNQASITNENSQLLRTLGTLRQNQQKLEGMLNVAQNKILSRMTGGSKVASAQDRRHLKELVIVQQQEIDGLKNEIAMLRRKGGHVYTPVVNKVVT